MAKIAVTVTVTVTVTVNGFLKGKGIRERNFSSSVPPNPLSHMTINSELEWP